MVDKKTASFMRSLAMGHIEEEILVPYPEPKVADKETLHAIFQSLKGLLGGREKDFRAWDRAGEMPPGFVQELKEAGLFSVVVPERFGGLGLGATAYSRVVQELGKYDASAAVTVGAHSSIGMRGLLLFGTEEQKARWLPRLATGELVAAFCLTEPGAGSDAAGIKTTAVRDGDDWVLNGEKLWITNGGIADFFTVFAKTSLEGRGHITAFVVTRDLKGVSTGPHEDKMGIRASSTTTVVLEDVRVPAGNVLGEVGKGFKVAMRILNAGRTGLGGGSVGGMKRLIELAARQARERVQFGKPIASFESIQQKIGQMVVDCYAAESVVNLVAGLVDRGFEETQVEAAISKVLASEALWRTADEALQIAGGSGYMRELPYELALRDSRINRIFEGTNEILRLFIALTALDDVGAELAEVAESMKGALADPIKGFGVLSDYAKRRAALATGLRRTKGTWTLLHPALAQDAARFESATRHLALAADKVVRRHGKNIVGQQLATRRLADAMIDLFTLAAMLTRISARIEDHGEAAVAVEREILRAFARQAERRVEAGLAQLDDNEDPSVLAVANHVLEVGKYEWDNV
ncbi:acyl-CoA dehydrogenase family protein [Anaeromyxobacter oryzae]|uniref:Acyl-CoA dehydrogenase n=1 Tax=Anaeromyxobacter oryzae TaxID=2918170 RepID=A0ABN6MTZ0_9BACT|nr:acyl-CoA dehydrogenase family protein [Anaeromyxobacter oryzae]BDG03228.1 acyl-CoA dehydrogenase [Anaeromyxobacter oryzae]